MIRKLPVGLQDFESLRNENYVYVDKTKLIYQLITQGCMYFFSRPRRFGKSLLVSTLHAIFRGKRHLFKDLWIDQSDYNWEEYPVIRLDMSAVTNSSPELLKQSLSYHLEKIAKQYGVTITPSVSVAGLLNNLIIELAKKYNKRVVVLIDEYDNPLVEQIHRPNIATQNYEILRHFYVVLKTQGANIHFVLMTGVSKFSMASGFSGLNNLDDISLTTRYSTLTGFTQQELTDYFSPEIDLLAEKEGLSRPVLLDKIKFKYYGYQFSSDDIGVYNSFEILLLLKNKKFSDYWFDTGNPRLLVDLIQERKFGVSGLEDLKMDSTRLWMYEIGEINTKIVSLLYQTGYLTIKSYDQGMGYYTLGYPNREVKKRFVASLLVDFSKEKEPAFQSDYIFRMTDALKKQSFDDFFQVLKEYLARIPYELPMPAEKYYPDIFYLLFTLVGLGLKAEVQSNREKMRYDRETLAIDKIENKDNILIFGVSGIIPDTTVDTSAKGALKQIKKKGYAEQYMAQKKAVYLIGLNFNAKERNVSEYLIEKLG